MSGEVVWIRHQAWRVHRTRVTGPVMRIDASRRGRRHTFLAPFDRVCAGGQAGPPRRIRPQQARARLAQVIAHVGSRSMPLAAVTADIALLPHQIEPVLAVLQGARRVLIADEVGLGKTIQAGLVAAELTRPRAASGASATGGR